MGQKLGCCKKNNYDEYDGGHKIREPKYPDPTGPTIDEIEVQGESGQGGDPGTNDS